MTPQQIEALGPAFADYLEQFAFCCDYPQTFHLLGVYCRGLLSDLPRKSAEPIALYARTAVRTLPAFLRAPVSSYPRARAALPQYVARTPDSPPPDNVGT